MTCLVAYLLAQHQNFSLFLACKGLALQGWLASPPTVPQSPPPVAQPPPPAAPQAKTARQEMLVKKLVTLLPPGTSEETIKKSIQVLRAKNGKLSGWPTSKIAAAINELIQGGEV